MFELAMVFGFGALTLHATRHKDDEILLPPKIGDKVGKLWKIAHQGMRENRLLRAEKALLSILQMDQKNAPAYNRLGILYAKQKEYKDAIDCFEIASSIEPTASSLHNLGLIYFETENFVKAAAAFEQALKLEEELAARHIAYAKVQEQLGNSKLMLQELERAVELEPNNESYNLLIKAYFSLGMEAEADITGDKLKKHITPSGGSKRVVRARRVVV